MTRSRDCSVVGSAGSRDGWVGEAPSPCEVLRLGGRG